MKKKKIKRRRSKAQLEFYQMMHNKIPKSGVTLNMRRIKNEGKEYIKALIKDFENEEIISDSR